MKIFGHCRFSYYGLTDTGREVQSEADAAEKLWNAERMAVRFHLFENILLPSIKHQTDPDFTLVVTCSELMPSVYHDRLEAAVAEIPQIRLLRTPDTNISRVLRPVMLEANNDGRDTAIHFRVDDDDALGVDYVARLRRVSAMSLPPYSLITFPTGVMGFLDGTTPRHMPQFKPSIAIGLAVLKAPEDLRTIFHMQHKRYGQHHPTYSDPTFAAFHYTRHTTNNTNGYNQVIHRDGDVPDTVARRARKAFPEFEDGAVTTAKAEQSLAEAFPYTTGEYLRRAIAATLRPADLLEPRAQ
jgi:hypothetical protein